MQIVTLLTDFGLTDTYVPQMKAVIYSLAPHCTLVDLTHHIPPQNLFAGASALAETALHFPIGTIHIAVVDPGVGTRRKLMAAKIADHYFVMPDNGLITRLLEAHPLQAAVELTEPKFWRPAISSTFHGRDIMAPVASHLANGTRLSELGPALNSLVQLSFAKPIRTTEGIKGTVLVIDHFGNAITNIPRSMIGSPTNDDSLVVSVHQRETQWRFVETYGQAAPGACLALVGSQGHLELAVNCGSAAKEAGIRVGDEILVALPKIHSNG